MTGSQGLRNDPPFVSVRLSRGGEGNLDLCVWVSTAPREASPDFPCAKTPKRELCVS
jgi:hypothetical protein